MSKPSVFISYSHNDEKWVKEFLLFKSGITDPDVFFEKIHSK